MGEDYFNAQTSMEELWTKMEKSQETSLGFSFLFGFDTDADALYQFAKLLRREGLFY